MILHEYCMNFTVQGNKFCLSLHYNGSNSYLFVNRVRMYSFKAKDFELNACPVCLENISKDLVVDNIRKTGRNGCLIFWLVMK